MYARRFLVLPAAKTAMTARNSKNGGQIAVPKRGSLFVLQGCRTPLRMHSCTYVLISVNTQTTYSRMMEIIKMKKYCLKKGIPRAIRSTLRRCLTRITIGSKRHHNKNSARLVVGSPSDFWARARRAFSYRSQECVRNGSAM